MESPKKIKVLFKQNRATLKNGGRRRIFQAAHQNAAGIPRPIKVPKIRRLKSFCAKPSRVQKRTSSGIKIGNESFFMSASEWLLARLMRLTSSRQNPPAC